MTDNALNAYGQPTAPDQSEGGEINRTLLEEFPYKELFTSNAERSATLGTWVRSYKDSDFTRSSGA